MRFMIADRQDETVAGLRHPLRHRAASSLTSAPRGPIEEGLSG
jgi:hypothetical protein